MPYGPVNSALLVSLFTIRAVNSQTQVLAQWCCLEFNGGLRTERAQPTFVIKPKRPVVPLIGGALAGPIAF